MGQQGSGFDISRLSTASKILLGGGVLFLVDSFLPWQRVCVDVGFGMGGVCASASGWGGDAGFAGVLAGLFVIALIVWEALAIAGVSTGLAVPASKVSAGLGLGVLVFAVLKFLLVITNEAGFGAYIGIVLALVIGYGAWMKFQEPETSAPSAGGEGGGGFTS